MSSSIVFNDGGAATLANQRPVPFDRFSGWTADSMDIKHEGVAVGTGDISVWIFRTEYFARFELRNIPDTQFAVMNRLKRHLERGGSVTVNTGDLATRVYTAKKRPGTQITIEPNDAQRRLFAMKFELKNTAAADMILEY